MSGRGHCVRGSGHVRLPHENARALQRRRRKKRENHASKTETSLCKHTTHHSPHDGRQRSQPDSPRSQRWRRSSVSRASPGEVRMPATQYNTKYITGPPKTLISPETHFNGLSEDEERDKEEKHGVHKTSYHLRPNVAETRDWNDFLTERNRVQTPASWHTYVDRQLSQNTRFYSHYIFSLSFTGKFLISTQEQKRSKPLLHMDDSKTTS